MSKLDDTLAAIMPVGKERETDARAHLNNLTKPPGSLGKLEDIALKYCLITGTTKPIMGGKKIFCFAGDHGVAAEGVSAFPKEVTPQMVLNMLGGGAAINVLTRHVGADLAVVDMGVDDSLEGAEGLIRRKIKNGTDNIAEGPAMTKEEAREALEVGIALAEEAKGDGVSLLGTGEMGIANTTPSSALLSVLLDVEVEAMVGRGTGVDDAGLARKIEVIQRALAANKAEMSDPLSTLAALGGLEIAGIAGLILGAASLRIPVMVDGFISTAGAVVAMKMDEKVKDYLFFSHLSHEQGHTAVFQSLGIEPILSLGMRLGEGTGAALAMSIVEAAIKIYNEMATFDSAGVDDKG